MMYLLLFYTNTMKSSKSELLHNISHALACIEIFDADIKIAPHCLSEVEISTFLFHSAFKMCILI